MTVVIDAQVHIWQEGNPPPNHRQAPFGAEDLIEQMKACGVDRAVLVPPLWDPSGNTYSVEAARQYPDRFAVMGLVDLSQPKGPDDFRAWIQAEGIKGVRISFNNPALRARLARGEADWLWESAAAAGVPVMVLAPYNCALLGAIARQHPQLRMVVDHMAIPRGAKAPEAFEHLPELVALAQYDNLAVKMGGVPNYASEEGYPYASLRPYLRQVIDAFGAQRCFWASDYSRLIGPYEECVAMFRDGLDWLSEDERDAILGGGIANWLGWPA